MAEHDEAKAECSRAQAVELIRYDHHRVVVNGRAGVMLTYDWPDPAKFDRAFALRVVFAYAEKHPAAPEHVQAIVDALDFN